MVAERAGVQRHTLYAHFPDERSLLLACSGLAWSATRCRMPRHGARSRIRRERLRTGLRAIYGWYARNAALAACVLRDAEHHALTREIIELRIGPPMAAALDVLGTGLDRAQLACLRLALGYHAWRSLGERGGIDRRGRREVMARAVECARQAPDRAL